MGKWRLVSKNVYGCALIAKANYTAVLAKYKMVHWEAYQSH